MSRQAPARWHETARRNELFFRAIIKSLQSKKEMLPKGYGIPDDLNPDAELEALIRNCTCRGDYFYVTEHRPFYIDNFQIKRQGVADITLKYRKEMNRPRSHVHGNDIYIGMKLEFWYFGRDNSAHFMRFVDRY